MAEKKRRGHNEGSVYYDASRDRWVADIAVGPGKRKKYRFKKKQDAIKKKNEALRELEQGTLATGERRRLGEYLKDWLENVHKSKLRTGTYVNYQKKVSYIVAGLGDVWLQKLTPEQVQDFLQKKLDGGLSSKTVHEIHGVLRVALKNAARWGLVSRNVCEVVAPPRIVSREPVPLSVEQARVLVKYVQGHRLEVMLAMAVVTAMRRGELLALRWSDIDFNRGCLLVLHSVDYIAKHGYVEGKPKTAAGKRMISLPTFLLGMLEQHRVQQLALRSVSSKWIDNDLVFPNLSGGYLHPNHMGEKFRKILREAELPHIHFHDLRHSAATILMCMGVNIKVIQQLLGHSDISVTLRVYGHLLPSMQEEVVETWDGVFGENGKGSRKSKGKKPGGRKSKKQE